MISAIALANKYYKKINKETREDFIRLHDFRHNSMSDFIECYLPYHSNVMDLVSYMNDEFVESFKKFREVATTTKMPANMVNSYKRLMTSYARIKHDFSECAMIRFCLEKAINLQIVDTTAQLCPKFKLDSWLNLEGTFAVSLATKGNNFMHICLIECALHQIRVIFLEVDKEVTTMPIEVIISKHEGDVFVKYYYDNGGEHMPCMRFTLKSLQAADNNEANMKLAYEMQDYLKFLADHKGNNDSIDVASEDPVFSTVANLLLSCQYAIEEYVFYSSACRREATVTKHSAKEQKKHEGNEVQVITLQEEFKYVPISSLADKIYYGHRDWQGGTHASPYAHYRSGHQRRLKDGRIVNVRSSAVGGTPEQKEAIAIAAATGSPIPFYGKTKKIYVTD